MSIVSFRKIAKFNYRFVFRFIGFLLLIESVFMCISALVGVIFHEPVYKKILYSALITCLSGGLFILIGRKNSTESIGKREGFLSVTLSWIMLSVFGMLPYLISGTIPQVENAFFETMSGFTTTGSSILTNIEAFPKSLLFWRSFTQWIGGIGIIVFIITFLPFFGGSAIQLFDAEVSGFLQNQITPRISQIAKRLSLTYLLISIVGFLVLWCGPISAFDAACHVMTSISTGGFSTKQSSVAYFQSAYVEYVLTVLMFIGGTNFTLIYLFFKKRSFKVFKDEEFKWFYMMVIIFTVGITVSLLNSGRMESLEYTFRTSLFQTISILTTTGAVTFDYTTWGFPYVFIFLSMMLFCASAGSTTGGMKISRLIVLAKNTLLEFKRQVHPSAVLSVKLNGKVIQEKVVSKILAFIFLYLSITAVSFFVLSLTGMPFDEAIGAAMTAIGNVGPGLGESGPSGSFADATVFAKLYMSFLMLIGRLEIFTVLSLFIPSFWK